VVQAAALAGWRAVTVLRQKAVIGEPGDGKPAIRQVSYGSHLRAGKNGQVDEPAYACIRLCVSGVCLYYSPFSSAVRSRSVNGMELVCVQVFIVRVCQRE